MVFGRKWLVANFNRVRGEYKAGKTKRADAVAELVRFGCAKNEAENVLRRKTAYR